METIEVKIKKLDENAVIPKYAKKGDACMDLVAIGVRYIPEIDCFEYHTGLSVEIPEGYEMQIRPRSSIRKTEAIMQNSPGTIDSGYRGEILVCYKNRTNSTIVNLIRNIRTYITKFGRRLGVDTSIPIDLGNIKPFELGERIAQCCVVPVPQTNWTEVEELSDTERGDGGHGSTGK